MSIYIFQAAYNRKDDVYQYLRQVMALPFLPAEHIPSLFDALDERANNEHLDAVMVYIYNTRLATRGPVPFYVLVLELYKEATDIPLHLKLMSKGKMKRTQRKATPLHPGDAVFSVGEVHQERSPPLVYYESAPT
jgi:hypothetical protein